ncbi:unnamed protein product, partial [Effrenium voratum]
QAHPACSAVACEVYDRCAEVAVRVLAQNGLSHRAKVVNKVASDLEVGSDLPRRADVCVFELFDSQLLGESILPILRDAQARLLRPDCTFVPRRVTVRCRLVSCPTLAPADLPELRGAAWPLMLGQMSPGFQSGVAGEVLTALSDAWDAFDIDFGRLPEVPRAERSTVKVTRAGAAHGVAWWWELDLGGGLRHSSWTTAARSDEARPARNHWRPCLSFLGRLDVEEGQEVAVTAAHDDEGVWFTWGCQGVPPRWLEGVTRIPPERERLLMAASETWSAPLRAAAAEAAAHGGPVLLLPAEDCLSLGVMAEGLGSVPGRVLKPKHLAQCDTPMPGVAVLGPDEAVAAVVLEPFALGDELPWLKAFRCLPGGAHVPAAAHGGVTILAVLVECEGAWLARQPLGKLCGVSMEAPAQ